MRAPPKMRGAPSVGSPVAGDANSRRHDNPQITLAEYASSLSTGARDAGLERAREGDLDDYGPAALEVIRRRTALGVETSAADVRRELGAPPSSGVLGAFRTAAIEGTIRMRRCQKSPVLSRHSGVERVWGPA